MNETMTPPWARQLAPRGNSLSVDWGQRYPATAPAAAGVGNLGGLLPVMSATAVLEQRREQDRRAAETANAEPVMQNLAAHIHRCWADARDARASVTREMIDAARAKEGRYPPEMEARLREQGGSTVYMMLFASKARAVKALVGDVLTGSGSSKPWTLSPTPVPTLPEDVTAGILQATMQAVAQAEQAMQPMTMEQVRQLLRDARERAMDSVNAEARERASREETRMEDMLLEGGFYTALGEFLDDLPVYPTAFIKGPTVRRVGTLTWRGDEAGEYRPQVTEALVPQWERVDPMRVYPSRGARTLQDGYLIELHDLTIEALQEMKGVPGYSDGALDLVIEENAHGRLMSEWAMGATDRPDLDRPGMERPAQTVQAVQFWGRVPGGMLIEWGMDESDVPDATASYDVEAWLIGQWVIRAIINTDPLALRPYFGCSYENAPGRVWGQSLYAIMRDCEAMCNAAARALDVNMGVSSGPQVAVNVDRMPPGEAITSMYPWKIWQFGSDPSGSSAAPIAFFSPTSNAAELMAVYEKFSELADEYTGVPRYMTGNATGVGGAGRTASGMSMMIGNASKTVKSLVSSLDARVFTPLLTALHVYIMRFVDDPDIKGDVNVVARGAQSLAVKEAAQLRRNEFLQATANPIDMQIIGPEGRAALLRESAKMLDMNPDLVVPSASEVRARVAQQQQQALLAQQQQQAPAPDQTQLVGGAPVTQNFDPQRHG